MTSRLSLVSFTLDSLRLALPLAAVQRVVPAAELTPLPVASALVAGVLNLAGELVPVLNLRPRFRLPVRRISIEDHFLLVRSNGRIVALLVDEVQDVMEVEMQAATPGAALVPGAEAIREVVKLEDGLLLVNDPNRFLDLVDFQALERALDEYASGEA